MVFAAGGIRRTVFNDFIHCRRRVLAVLFVTLFLAAGGAFVARPVRAQEGMSSGQNTQDGGKAQFADLFSGDVGISFKGVSLDIQEPGSDLVLTTMEAELRPTLALNLQSPVVYFGGWPVGYVFRYGLDFFTIETQDTPLTLDQQDMGTSVNGFFLYFMPTLVFDTTKMPGPARPGTRFGIGLGIGYLSAEGDFILLDIDAPYPYPEQRRTIDVSSLGLGGYMFSEYLLGRLVFGLRAGFFNASGGGYDYVVGDYSLDMGFRSRF